MKLAVLALGMMSLIAGQASAESLNPTISCRLNDLQVDVFYSGYIPEVGEDFTFLELAESKHSVVVKKSGDTFLYNLVTVVTDGAGNETITAYAATDKLSELFSLFYDHEEGFLRGKINVNGKVYTLGGGASCHYNW